MSCASADLVKAQVCYFEDEMTPFLRFVLRNINNLHWKIPRLHVRDINEGDIKGGINSLSVQPLPRILHFKPQPAFPVSFTFG